MKKLFFACMMVFGLLSYAPVKSQVHVNINVGAQPAWGPSGYDYVEYYYLPDIDAYYDVPKKQFVYFSGNRWLFAPGPPPQYRNFDLHRSYKVVINEPKPYLKHKVYHAKYLQYKGNYGKQKVLRDNPGNANGHYKNKGASSHKQRGKGNAANGDGNGKGNKHGGGNGKHK